MTTETPVREWDFPYEVDSLPNGMPRPRLGTAIGAAGVRALDSRDDAALWGHELALLPGGWPTAVEAREPARGLVFEHYLISTPPTHQHLVISGQAAPFSFRFTRDADARPLGELVDGARRLLGLEVEEVSALLGVKRRTFYDLAKVQEPASTRQGVGDRARILMALAEIDPLATADLVRRDPARAAELLARGAFITLRDDLEGLRTERLALETSRPAIRSLGEIPDGVLAAIADLASRPSLDLILAGIQAIAPDLAPDRLVAAADVARNVQAAHDGDDVDAEWSFLVTMRHEEMDALGGRALAMIRSADFSREEWRRFVAQEAEAARATAGFVPLEPDDEEAVSGGEDEWAPDLAAFGSSLRYSDYNRGS